MAKKVRDAMTPEPRVADPSLSLVEAAQLMKSEDIGRARPQTGKAKTSRARIIGRST